MCMTRKTEARIGYALYTSAGLSVAALAVVSYPGSGATQDAQVLWAGGVLAWVLVSAASGAVMSVFV